MNRKTAKAALVFVLLNGLVSDIRIDVARKINELNQVRDDIDSARQTMQRLIDEKNKLQSELASVEKRYGDVAASVKALSDQVSEREQTVDDLEHSLRVIHQQLSEDSIDFRGQVRTYAATGNKEQLKLVFSQQNTMSSSRALAYYHYWQIARQRSVDRIHHDLSEQAQLKGKKTVAELALHQTDQHAQNEQLVFEQVKQERDSLIDQLNYETSSHEQQVNRLKEGEEKLRNLIASLEGQAIPESQKTSNTDHTQIELFSSDSDELTENFSAFKGRLLWPVQGQVAQRFGSQRAEIAWDGIVIDANEGAEVRAVSDGKVAFADWLRGYGLLVIVEHGGGYMSLYAFNQSLYCKKGDHAKAGQMIASVGQSGGRSRAGLYFGIRNKGVAVDPLLWLVKKNKDSIENAKH